MTQRLKAITTLLSLQDRILDSKASQLVASQAHLSKIETARAELDRRRTEECDVSMPEAMPYMASFLTNLHSEMRVLGRAEALAVAEVDARRQEVMEAFREARSTKQLRETIVRDRLVRNEFLEQADQDERNIILHARSSRH